MKCSAFIATSADGYIATPEGGVEWLENAGKPEPEDPDSFGDGGFSNYLSTVDCMIMGRKCMQKIASFKLPPEQWPYGDIPIHVLSRSITTVPDALPGTVSLFSGDIPALVNSLSSGGYRHAYIDGGATITSFIELGLLNELTVTQAPLLLGEGLPLFGTIGRHIRLSDAEANVFPNDFIQWRYRFPA